MQDVTHCIMYCGGMIVRHFNNSVKSHIQEQTNKMSEEFRAVTYREQIMAGTDYFITVHAGGSSYLHMIVSGKLLCPGGKCELTGVEEGHTKDDPLEPF
uniref:Cystatin domain-containing protein n=1 Tax=Stegastes partitus TaxID=144197 RepID=A0A3B4ZCJ0_9TELE